MNGIPRWATLATALTTEDVADAIRAPDANFATPGLQLAAEARAKGYDTLSLPLTTDNWRKRWTEMCLIAVDATDAEKQAATRAAEEWRLRPGFLKDEVTISRLDEAEGVIVMVSEWLELDAPDDGIRHDAEILAVRDACFPSIQALQQELAYASYLNIQSAILPPPRNRDHVASYARIINSCLTATPYLSLSVRLPIYDPSVFQAGSPKSAFQTPSRGHGAASPSTPALVVSDSTPERPHNSETSLNATWEMWDLIRSMCDYNPRLTLTLDLSPALPSTLGVLSKWAAESVRYIFLPATTFITNMKGYPVLPKPTQAFLRDSMIAHINAGSHSRGGENAYSQYVRYLEKTSPPVQAAQKPGTVENFAQGYQDYLQAPLQPLMDNLPSITYQTFEQDPVKYAQYEEHRQDKEWGTKVHLIFGDMRSLEVPEEADILVSELLGSFGDNELSPECLDGAMRFLKPDGISIPSSYTAHLAPLSSSKLYNEARSKREYPQRDKGVS
ncbi:hypothetical protein EST38_g12075 [Candolleomyces aberdarensis]|uniref:Protein arginine N-methyltransferase n=1 Tax=Candolleomyces aberdarensis TaxID=2316362 RepID=A0A4Q2D3A8_9AGAR|nr:hypothetical protein EST38_g12075 [Candolleomyces aberdarensis]